MAAPQVWPGRSVGQFSTILCGLVIVVVSRMESNCAGVASGLSRGPWPATCGATSSSAPAIATAVRIPLCKFGIMRFPNSAAQ